MITPVESVVYCRPICFHEYIAMQPEELLQLFVTMPVPVPVDTEKTAPVVEPTSDCTQTVTS